MNRTAIVITSTAVLLTCSGCKSCKKPAPGDTRETPPPAREDEPEPPPRQEPHITEEMKYNPTVEILQDRCDQGGAVHCETLADKLFGGEDVKQDMPRAVKLYEKAAREYEKRCNEDQPRACRSLALMWLYGKGVKKDELEALRLMRKALSIYKLSCDEGNLIDCCWAASYFSDNEVLEKNEQRADEFLERGLKQARKMCDDGEAAGCNNLAVMYREGLCGLQKDEKMSQKYMDQAREILSEQ